MEKVKDPNKPKRPSSAFFVFTEKFRKQYKQKHPHVKSVAAVSKAGVDKWRSLSDAEKDFYVAEADERKARYEKAMKAYNKRWAEGTKEGAEESKKSRSQLITKEEDHEGSDEEKDDNSAFRIMEKVVNPNKPKRPSSAFFIFMEEFRKQYKQKHPHVKSVAAVGKAGGDKWKSLSDAEKAPYVAGADERKAKFEKDMKAYHKRRVEGAKEGAESKKSRSELIIKEEDHEGSDEEEDDNFVFRIMEKVEDPSKPKRPSSAFFVFMEEVKKQYKQKHPHIKSIVAIGRAGGDKWKSLSNAEKSPYEAEADERKAKYDKDMKAYNERWAEGTKEGADESKKSRSELIIKEENHEGNDEEEDNNFVFGIMEKVEDPNKPKRPSSAFFIFMEEFRKQYKQRHPHIKSIAAVCKAGIDKCWSLSDAEKAPYIAEADKRKAEYEKNMKGYNERLQRKTG